MQLRPYQLDLVDRLRAAFRQQRRVVAVAPTGAGKTVIASEIIKRADDIGRRVLFLAHRKELIDQASGKLDQWGVAHGIIMRGHPRADLSQQVQVASVQTLARRIETLAAQPDGQLITLPWQRPYDLIVVDECHHTTAGTYQRVLEAWPTAKVLGLTATPYRLDGRGLADCYDHLEVGIHVDALIEQGFLVPCVTYAPPPPEELARVKVRAGEYISQDAAKILDQRGPIDELIRTWQRHASDRLTAVFACTVEHAYHVAEAFRAAGVPAAAVDGSMATEERAAALAALRRGELRVIVNVMLLTEGWDLPELSCVVMARPTQSRALWRQMVGRGMRTAMDKAECLVLDHAGNALKFGSPNERDTYDLHAPARKKRSRRDADPRPSLVVCPHCRAVNERRARACVGCGAVLAIAVRERAELELQVLGVGGELERLRYFQRCLRQCRTSGKACKMYQIHRGAWPDAWMKVACGVYWEIHGRDPADGLVNFTQKKLAELRDAEHAAA